MIGFVIAITLTVFLGTALILYLASPRSAVAARLSEVGRVNTAPVERPVSVAETVSSHAQWFKPIRKAIGLADDSDVGQRLALAGYRNKGIIELYYGAKLLGPLLAALIAGFFLPKDNIIFWFIIMAAVGFFAPDFWLSSAVSRRREKVRLALPDAIDLLVICMEAGLGMDQALIRVGTDLQFTHRELSEELLLINLEQRAGKPRVEAWRAMADRTNLETVRSFVNMLVQTERFGTPLSKSLGFFADALRTRRRQMAEEMAAKTTIKLVFPLVLFIFPSMFIVLLAPAVIAIGKSLGQSLGN